MSINILAFKHFSFDDPYVLETWAREYGHCLRILDPAEGVQLDWLEALDMLIILGGPMSVYEEEAHPWLTAEKAFVREAMNRGVKILGICFGAQMLAELLGSPVYRHQWKEVGWHRVERTEEAHPWLEAWPDAFHSFQWHGDTYELPGGARLLATSAACGQQAFAYGEHVLAFQFHLETTPCCIDTMLERWSGELVDAPWIQRPEQILGETGRSETSFALLRSVLDRMAQHV